MQTQTRLLLGGSSQFVSLSALLDALLLCKTIDATHTHTHTIEAVAKIQMILGATQVLINFVTSKALPNNFYAKNA